MATFSFEEKHVIIRFLHLRGMKPIEIHQQLREKCNDAVIDVKNVRLWVQQFKEGRTSCENKPKELRPCSNRSEDMIARVEQLTMFWDSISVILILCVPKGSTVTGETYGDVLRAKFLPAMREKRPKKDAAVLFHQDNASPRRAALVHQFFDDNFEVVPHAPYSPGLTPLMDFNGFHATQVEESRAVLRM
jgi:hypothetical protein